MIPTLETLASLCLFAACVYLFNLARKRRDERDEARGQANDVDRELLKLRLKIIDLTGLDDAEFFENMANEHKTETVSSDEWQFDVPYGRWGEFPTTDGTPPPKIRAFWSGVPAKIFGVKMPVGSHYEMHSHHWAETLTCLTGTLTVEAEGPRGKVTTTVLNPGKSIFIPGGKRHAVAFAAVECNFVCIWTRSNLQPPKP